jgi:hypothetical protein
MFFKNKVKNAVERAGGVTHVANQLKCSGTSVHSWVRNGRVSNIEKAKLLSEMSGVALLDLRPC